jgi:hypothetical protein
VRGRTKQSSIPGKLFYGRKDGPALTMLELKPNGNSKRQGDNQGNSGIGYSSY